MVTIDDWYFYHGSIGGKIKGTIEFKTVKNYRYILTSRIVGANGKIYRSGMRLLKGDVVTTESGSKYKLGKGLA